MYTKYAYGYGLSLKACVGLVPICWFIARALSQRRVYI